MSTKLIKSPLCILLMFTFIKGIVWSAVIPPFQASDEQNHFAYIQFVAENGRRSIPWSEKNISEELALTLNLTSFSSTGTHPFYTFQKSKTTNGINEDEINKLPFESRKNYVQQAAGSAYPPIYYLIGSFFYKSLYNHPIIDRVYAVRLWSILLGVLTVLLVFKISELFLPKSKNIPLATAAIVTLHPSFSFITSTITIDALTIFYTTLLSYLWIMIFKDRLAWKFSLSVFLLSFLSIFVRETLSVAPAITLLVIVLRLKIKSYIKVSFLSGVALILYLFVRSIFFNNILSNTPLENSFRLLSNFVKQSNFLSSQIYSGELFKNVISYLNNLIRDFNNNIFSWYWAIFGWLEVQLPFNFYRIFKLLTVISFAGIVLISLGKKKDIHIVARKDLAFIIFLIFAIAFPIFLFDFQKFVSEVGHPFGFQGRYLLPGIAVQVFLFVQGLLVWVPKKYLKQFCLSLIGLFFLIHLVSLWQIIVYFYQPASLGDVVNRIGWYKPAIYKGSYMIGWFGLYILSFVWFLYNFLFKKQTNV